MSAENHTQRAILDCFKYLCISIAERIDMFRQDYRKVDLNLANNGEFLPKLDKLEDKARKAYVTAKKAEIEKKGEIVNIVSCTITIISIIITIIACVV